MARAALIAQIEDALKIAQRAESDAVKNQISLFGKSNEPAALTLREPVEEWPQKDLLKFEKEALGFYITAHPLDKYDRELRRDRASLPPPTCPARPTAARSASRASSRRSSSRTTKRVSATRHFSLEDREGAVECIVWPEAYQKYESVIMGDEPVVAKGKLDVDDERAQIILDELRPLAVALTDAVREVRIRAPRAPDGQRRSGTTQGSAAAPQRAIADLSCIWVSTTAAKRSFCSATATGSRRPRPSSPKSNN